MKKYFVFMATIFFGIILTWSYHLFNEMTYTSPDIQKLREISDQYHQNKHKKSISIMSNRIKYFEETTMPILAKSGMYHADLYLSTDLHYKDANKIIDYFENKGFKVYNPYKYFDDILRIDWNYK